MVITVSSVGDIISVCLLVKDLVVALNSIRGSSAEYQAVVQELHMLDIALLQVERLARTQRSTPHIEALYETGKTTVEKCRISISRFMKTIDKFEKSLATGGSGNVVKDTARKFQWKLSGKEEQIAAFRAEITGYTESISMLLATAKLNTLHILETNLSEHTSDTARSLNQQQTSLVEINNRLEENKQLIVSGNTVGSRILERVEWVRNLGAELKRFMSRIIAGNFAIYREIVALRSAFTTRVGHSLCEDPFILEDAIGRTAPVHLRFINSWQAFDAVMEIRFKGKQGLPKIQRKEYILEEDATGLEIDRSIDFSDCFLPGQKIVMSLVFKNESAFPGPPLVTLCPRCQAPSANPGDSNILCDNCNMWFRRIEEIYEVDPPQLSIPRPWEHKAEFGKPSFQIITESFGPARPKRKLEEIDGEDGDFTRFKRIRLVSRRKQVRIAKHFTTPESAKSFKNIGVGKKGLQAAKEEMPSVFQSTGTLSLPVTATMLPDLGVEQKYLPAAQEQVLSIHESTSGSVHPANLSPPQSLDTDSYLSESEESANDMTPGEWPEIPEMLGTRDTSLEINPREELHPDVFLKRNYWKTNDTLSWNRNPIILRDSRPAQRLKPIKNPQTYVRYEDFPLNIYFPAFEDMDYESVIESLLSDICGSGSYYACSCVHGRPIIAPASCIWVKSGCNHHLTLGFEEEVDLSGLACSKATCPLKRWARTDIELPAKEVVVCKSSIQNLDIDVPAYFFLILVLINNISRESWGGRGDFLGEFALYVIEDLGISQNARRLGPCEIPNRLMKNLATEGKHPTLGFLCTKSPIPSP